MMFCTDFITFTFEGEKRDTNDYYFYAVTNTFYLQQTVAKKCFTFCEVRGLRTV